MSHGALTLRERDVLVQLAKGSSNQSIATTLDMSVRTVETHLSYVYPKLGVKSRAAAVRCALLNGLAENAP